MAENLKSCQMKGFILKYFYLKAMKAIITVKITGINPLKFSQSAKDN